MKNSRLIIVIIIALLNFTNTTYSQECKHFLKSSNCTPDNIENLKSSSLSRSYNLTIGKTVTYEVILYGQKEILIQFCTEEMYDPLRFKLRSSVTGDLLYDNKLDNYNNSINLLLDQTELISIEISIASNNENSTPEMTKTCIGMAIYMEKIALRH